MRSEFMEATLTKYREFFDEPDDFEKGVLFATTQILEMLENNKSKITLSPHEDFWYIEPSVIKNIKQEFGV